MNSNHGMQLNSQEKRKYAQEMIGDMSVKELSTILSVDEKTVRNWTETQRKAIEEERNRKIVELYLRAWNNQESIADIFGIDRSNISKIIANVKNGKIAEIQQDWGLNSDDRNYDKRKPFPYNIWNLEKKQEEKNYFGHFPQIFMENLLWYHTEPLDIVFDPFAGSGTTIDACKAMFRRYYCSDRKVIPGREKDIKECDILDGLPEDLPKTDLVFLDPPYCQQARGKYSDSEHDLGNMTLEKFYETMFQIFVWLAEKKIKKIAFVIFPSQWGMENKIYEPHDYYFGKKLEDLGYRMIMKYILPYASEQYSAQQVIKAKEMKIALNLDRTLQVWEMR